MGLPENWEALIPSRKKEILRYFLWLKTPEAHAHNLEKTLHVLSGRKGRFMARAWERGAWLEFLLHRPAYRKAAAGHVVGQPLDRCPRTRRHQGSGQLGVVVVEHLEAVVAAIAHAVQPAHQLGHFRPVHAFAGKHAEVPRGIDALLVRGQFPPHEVGEL